MAVRHRVGCTLQALCRAAQASQREAIGTSTKLSRIASKGVGNNEAAKWGSAEGRSLIGRQKYHSSFLLLDVNETAAESSTGKWDVGHPPVDPASTERGETPGGQGAGDKSDQAGRSPHTLKKGHTPEPQTEVADTPSLGKARSTREMLDEEQKQREESLQNREAQEGGSSQPSQTPDGLTPEAAIKSNMIAAEEGKQLWCMGVKVTLKCPGESTNGAYCLLEYSVAPGDGSSTHTHEREDETWYMLDGNLRWQLGDKTYDAKPGSFIHLPRGVPHSFHNVSDKPARMLVSCIPAGFEKYFLEIGTPVEPDDATKGPSASQTDLIASTDAGKKYGISFAKDV